ncbi:uncharacterized protein NPIL_616621 [Nephila pilipes]|uniref:Uncharacterized protein n=1 Tax=Nephila pilipes TaxID=299642 RepID=A0A8X6P7W3_NEPPI|nr:uncharacterized protein NPIL_616621 [Nephila pilipes]
MFAYRARGLPFVAGFWAFNLEIQDKYNIAMIFVGGYTYYKIFVECPFLFVFSACVLIHHYGLLLLQSNNAFKSVDFSTTPSNCIQIINTYSRIEEKLRLLTETLSESLFILLFIGFVNLYSALVFYLEEEIPTFYLPDICICASTGVLVVCSLTIYTSKIPQYMLEIKNNVRLLINKYEVNNLKCEKEFRLLRRMEKNDIIYLSACGMVSFQKSLLLSAFGTFFTYALLIEKS